MVIRIFPCSHSSRSRDSISTLNPDLSEAVYSFHYIQLRKVLAPGYTIRRHCIAFLPPIYFSYKRRPDTLRLKPPAGDGSRLFTLPGFSPKIRLGSTANL